MGLIVSQWFDDWVGQFFQPTQMLLLGLDNAGKTQILYCMKLGEAISNTMPTMGFNIETIQYKNLTFKAWDLGGQTTFRTMWHHYYEHTDAVIFVIDSNDRERFKESKQELHALLSNESLRNCPFLIFANKQDLPQAAEITELKKAFELKLFDYRQNVHLVACEAINNTRVTTGLDWLANAI
jgi:small GTP-binding protein